MLKKIEDLRKELHSHPELSGKEVQTAIRIKKFVEENNNTEIITGLGGNGLAVKYTFSDEGPVVMIRCELDALPIDEPNSFNHRSTTAGVSHKCGHDGHMAIVAGISSFINEQGFDRGSLILLFQPAEETGKGAAAILKDPKFETLQPDYVFALHNIPGEPLNSIITVQHLFSPAVQSIAIYLTGKKSHASEPENGINPALAIAEIINELSRLNVADVDKKDFARIAGNDN